MSIIDLEGNVLFTQYFNPKEPIHFRAYKKHKINTKSLNNHPKWNERWEEISKISKDKIILIHNDKFDKRLIKQTCFKYGINLNIKLNTVCTMEYTKQKFGILKLESVFEFLEIKLNYENLHNSLIDCFMCLNIINQYCPLDILPPLKV